MTLRVIIRKYCDNKSSDMRINAELCLEKNISLSLANLSCFCKAQVIYQICNLSSLTIPFIAQRQKGRSRECTNEKKCCIFTARENATS